MTSKTIIVTGGRDYDKKNIVWAVLDFLTPTKIINGGANGADKLAREWAQIKGVTCLTYRADWVKYGRAAGPIRNELMVTQNPTATLIAFPGNKGTQSCIDIARKHKMLVFKVGLKNQE